MATVDWRNFDSKKLRFDEVINTKGGGRTVPIHYDNDGRLESVRIQTPRATCPFEPSKPYEKEGKKSWSLSLSFGDHVNNPTMNSWYRSLHYVSVAPRSLILCSP